MKTQPLHPTRRVRDRQWVAAVFFPHLVRRIAERLVAEIAPQIPASPSSLAPR